jgi:DNA polymerase III delta prime subunit
MAIFVSSYAELIRKLDKLNKIAAQELLGALPDDDPAIIYISDLSMRSLISTVQAEALAELLLTKFGKMPDIRDDFLRVMTDKMQETVKDLEGDLCVTAWDETGNPLFDLKKFMDRVSTWPNK